MARGNGSGIRKIPLEIPIELFKVIELYKIRSRQVSTNAAIRILLETHPVITGMAADLIQLHQEGTTPATPERN